ncbi:hypothetical protein [uncultured Tessaracoccus sp.]|uniref:arsenate reductase/protein-tyrosine-phosphatase family protein n=1 Tax=uncultured Tessaracoccus sp. TaxID=905023 RepID=UPI0026166275|nr:hypothetical protein [uncultured Tessaracoccus sp.]
MSSYRVHPDTAWVHDPKTDTIHVMSLPAGEPMMIGGTGCVIYLDVVAGLDPVAEALNRWDAPEDEVRTGTVQFLQALVEAGVLMTDKTPAAKVERKAVVEETPEEAQQVEALRELRLLFVCTANICRSAYADRRMRHLGLPGIVVNSAGTQALVGQPVDPPMARHLTDPNDGSNHSAKQITRDLVEGANLIIAMSERHRNYILEEWPQAAMKTFLIGHMARELQHLPDSARPEDVAPYLWAHRTVERGDSVHDPYGRGDSVAEETARIIDSHLDVIAKVLGRTMMGALQ